MKIQRLIFIFSGLIHGFAHAADVVQNGPENSILTSDTNISSSQFLSDASTWSLASTTTPADSTTPLSPASDSSVQKSTPDKKDVPASSTPDASAQPSASPEKKVDSPSLVMTPGMIKITIESTADQNVKIVACDAQMALVAQTVSNSSDKEKYPDYPVQHNTKKDNINYTLAYDPSKVVYVTFDAGFGFSKLKLSLTDEIGALNKNVTMKLYNNKSGDIDIKFLDGSKEVGKQQTLKKFNIHKKTFFNDTTLDYTITQQSAAGAVLLADEKGTIEDQLTVPAKSAKGVDVYYYSDNGAPAVDGWFIHGLPAGEKCYISYKDDGLSQYNSVNPSVDGTEKVTIELKKPGAIKIITPKLVDDSTANSELLEEPNVTDPNGVKKYPDEAAQAVDILKQGQFALTQACLALTHAQNTAQSMEEVGDAYKKSADLFMKAYTLFRGLNEKAPSSWVRFRLYTAELFALQTFAQAAAIYFKAGKQHKVINVYDAMYRMYNHVNTHDLGDAARELKQGYSLLFDKKWKDAAGHFEKAGDYYRAAGDNKNAEAGAMIGVYVAVTVVIAVIAIFLTVITGGAATGAVAGAAAGGAAGASAGASVGITAASVAGGIAGGLAEGTIAGATGGAAAAGAAAASAALSGSLGVATVIATVGDLMGTVIGTIGGTIGGAATAATSVTGISAAYTASLGASSAIATANMEVVAATATGASAAVGVVGAVTAALTDIITALSAVLFAVAAASIVGIEVAVVLSPALIAGGFLLYNNMGPDQIASYMNNRYARAGQYYFRAAHCYETAALCYQKAGDKETTQKRYEKAAYMANVAGDNCTNATGSPKPVDHANARDCYIYSENLWNKAAYWANKHGDVIARGIDHDNANRLKAAAAEQAKQAATDASWGLGKYNDMKQHVLKSVYEYMTGDIDDAIHELEQGVNDGHHAQDAFEQAKKIAPALTTKDTLKTKTFYKEDGTLTTRTTGSIKTTESGQKSWAEKYITLSGKYINSINGSIKGLQALKESKIDDKSLIDVSTFMLRCSTELGTGANDVTYNNVYLSALQKVIPVVQTFAQSKMTPQKETTKTSDTKSKDIKDGSVKIQAMSDADYGMEHFKGVEKEQAAAFDAFVKKDYLGAVDHSKKLLDEIKKANTGFSKNIKISGKGGKEWSQKYIDKLKNAKRFADACKNAATGLKAQKNDVPTIQACVTCLDVFIHGKKYSGIVMLCQAIREMIPSMIQAGQAPQQQTNIDKIDAQDVKIVQTDTSKI